MLKILSACGTSLVSTNLILRGPTHYAITCFGFTASGEVIRDSMSGEFASLSDTPNALWGLLTVIQSGKTSSLKSFFRTSNSVQLNGDGA